MAISIAYRLTGAGWAECDILSGDAHCKVTASYLSDALGCLVMAALAVLSGFASISFRFEEEPGEYRWSLRELESGVWNMRILWFDDSYGRKPEDRGRELLSLTCGAAEFGVAVYGAAAQVLAEHGEAGYLEKWIEHAFPSEHFRLLKERLEKLGHEI